ncbi:helix-turn-helix transcriptional regulator [Peptacetobacter hiranonis]|uniref:DNA-binding helix-turn-helix protein n=1 Tax=Peptacetobacter hiranonis (strain DSM 13275 / JCM 10541 / KCTC 15199 / TO-931) TaxID=500633 RepID=B6FY94_PEPHT|nr:helix-turn-helix transcriptional regulator [Peptacetobacter hiranonis]EEA85489.1 DNA-binding helix-turn-helix protein [Peptacetobacter hiranonis DSM 13275]QEK20146.1 hypothetical protein KGNDJEFE_00627 [Peptacetobacter hiranonis]
MPESDYRKLLLIIGNNISIERKRQGLSKIKLVEKAEYYRVGLSRLEKGEQDIQLKTLLRISKALNVNPANLCTRSFERERSGYFEDDYLLIFADNIRNRLKKLNRLELSISSKGYGIDQTTISRILKGKIKNPRISTMNELAYAVSSDLSVLLKRNN